MTKTPILHEPINNYLLISVNPPEERSAGGLWIPVQAQNNAHEGTILKIGPLCTPNQFEEGDLVVFREHSGYKMKVDGEPVVLVDEGNIILKLPKKHVTPIAKTSAPAST